MKSEVSSFGELHSYFFTIILSWGLFLTKCFLIQWVYSSCWFDYIFSF